MSRNIFLALTTMALLTTCASQPRVPSYTQARSASLAVAPMAGRWMNGLGDVIKISPDYKLEISGDCYKANIRATKERLKIRKFRGLDCGEAKTGAIAALRTSLETAVEYQLDDKNLKLMNKDGRVIAIFDLLWADKGG